MNMGAWRCECSRGCGEVGICTNEAIVRVPVVSSSIIIYTYNPQIFYGSQFLDPFEKKRKRGMSGTGYLHGGLCGDPHASCRAS